MMHKDPVVHILHHKEDGQLQVVPYDPEAPNVKAQELMQQSQQIAMRQAQQPLMQPRLQEERPQWLQEFMEAKWKPNEVPPPEADYTVLIIGSIGGVSTIIIMIATIILYRIR
ncbi:unnamed protein product, partial [Allacma fusca]